MLLAAATAHFKYIRDSFQRTSFQGIQNRPAPKGLFSLPSCFYAKDERIPIHRIAALIHLLYNRDPVMNCSLTVGQMVQGEERVFNCCEIALSTEPDPDSHPLASPEMSRLRGKTQARAPYRPGPVCILVCYEQMSFGTG